MGGYMCLANDTINYSYYEYLHPQISFDWKLSNRPVFTSLVRHTNNS